MRLSTLSYLLLASFFSSSSKSILFSSSLSLSLSLSLSTIPNLLCGYIFDLILQKYCFRAILFHSYFIVITLRQQSFNGDKYHESDQSCSKRVLGWVYRNLHFDGNNESLLSYLFCSLFYISSFHFTSAFSASAYLPMLSLPLKLKPILEYSMPEFPGACLWLLPFMSVGVFLVRHISFFFLYTLFSWPLLLSIFFDILRWTP